MQTLELNKMGLSPITDIEMQETDGGGWWEKVIKGTIWYEIYHGVTSNWDEVKARFVEGWNIDQPKK
jgi:hypothetical protein